jgi:reactive intermediate/imine deaminase
VKTVIGVIAVTLALASSLLNAGDDVEFITGGGILPEGLPFSDAVRVGNTLYLSGQVGVVPGKMKLVGGGIAAESRQALENIRTVLEANGYALGDVVKCTVMLADMSEWGDFNEVYKTVFKPPYPARSAFGASGLALGAAVEVECIAARSGEH